MRRFRAGLALLVAGGVAARLVYVALTTSVKSFPVGGDALFYKFTAAHLAAGDGYVSPLRFFTDGHLAPTAEHPPLFSLFLALFVKLGANGITSQRLIVSGICGALVVAGVGLLGRRAAGERAGLIAAGFAAFFPTLVTADTSGESESLFGVLLVLALLAAYRLLDRRDMKSALALGAAIGLGTVARNEALLLLPLLALPVALRGGPGRWLRLGVTCAVAVVLVAPWVVRNWSVFDRPLLSTNYGQGLAGSNCQSTYYGKDLGGFSLLCFKVEPTRDEADWEADLAKQGRSYASHHKRRLPVVAAVRVLRGFGFYAPGSQLRIYNMSKPFQHVGIALYYPFLLIALAGLVVLVRRREPIAPLLSPILMTILVLAAYSGITRYRHASELAMAVLAGVAIDAALGQARRGPRQAATTSRH